MVWYGLLIRSEEHLAWSWKTMAIRVGINGFGRIGLVVFRAMESRGGGVEVAAIYEL